MNPLLRAGVELTLEKVAQEEQDTSLTHVLNQKIAEHDQGVVQVRESEGATPSSNSSEGMEDKDRHTNGTGPEEKELAAADHKTGVVQNAVPKNNITSETETQDLSLSKSASLASGVIASMKARAAAKTEEAPVPTSGS